MIDFLIMEDKLVRYVPVDKQDGLVTLKAESVITKKEFLACYDAWVRGEEGEWIDHSDEGYIECPFCGEATTCEDNIDELHYCWNCGAKMKRGKDNGCDV